MQITCDEMLVFRDESLSFTCDLGKAQTSPNLGERDSTEA